MSEAQPQTAKRGAGAKPKGRSKRRKRSTASQRSLFDWRGDLIALLAVIAVALAIRGIYLAQQHSDPQFAQTIMDSEFWHTWAGAFAEGETFADGPYYRAPLYAWVLGTTYKIFGSGPWAWRVMQAVLGALTCGLVFLLGRGLFNRMIGVIGGLVTGSYWILVYFTGEMLIPTLGTFLNLLLVWLLVLSDRKRTAWLWGTAGIVLGLSALARPNILLFAPVIVLWMLVSRETWARFLAHAVAITVGCLVAVLPVTVRNATVGGDAVLISSQGGVNLYIGNNPAADGISVVLPGARAHWRDTVVDQEAMAEAEAGRELTASEISSFYVGKTWQFVRDDPGTATKLLLAKLKCFWIGHEFANNQDIYDYTDRYTPIVKWLPLGFAVVGPLGLLGIFVTWPRRRELFPLWGFVLTYMVSVVLFFVSARFRVPVTPISILLGVVAGDWLVRSLIRREWALIALSAITLAILLFYSTSGSSSGPWRTEGGSIDMRVASSLLEEGKPDEAKAILDRLLEQQPALYRAWIEAASVDMVRGDHLQAESRARTGLKLNAQYYKAHEVLGASLASQGRLDEAIASFRQSIQLQPFNENSQRLLGFALLAKGDLDEARAHLEKAHEINPRQPDTLASLGVLEAREDNLEAALESFERAKEIDPLRPQVYLAQAEVWVSRGREHDAALALRDGLQQVPDEPRLLLVLAQLLATAGDLTVRDYDEAVALAERACELTGYRELQGVHTLASVYVLAGRCPKAIAMANRGIELAEQLNALGLVREFQALIQRCTSGAPGPEIAPPPPGD